LGKFTKFGLAVMYMVAIYGYLTFMQFVDKPEQSTNFHEFPPIILFNTTLGQSIRADSCNSWKNL